MKAEQIRNLAPSIDSQLATLAAIMQCEVAAQLAELNDKLEFICDMMKAREGSKNV